MGWPGAPVGKQHEVAGIIATLDRHASQQIRHAAIEDLPHSPGRLDKAESERLGDVIVNGASRGFEVELHAPAEKSLGVEHAEHEIGIGRRRLCAATPVASGTGRRAGAAGTDLQAAAVDGRDAATAGPDRLDVDGMDADIRARDGDVRSHDWLAVGDHAGIEAGAADVRHEDVAFADPATDGKRPHHATGRPREQAERGAIVEDGGRHDAPRTRHHEDGHPHAFVPQRGFQTREIAAGDRTEHGIGGRGRHPGVFADRRGDVVGHGDEDVGIFSRDDGLQSLLVNGIERREERADGDGLESMITGGNDLGAGARVVHRLNDDAVRIDALVDLDDQLARHQRGLSIAQIRIGQFRLVQTTGLSPQPSDFQCVAKPFGGEKECPGAFTGQQGVEPDRRAMPEPVGRRAKLLDAYRIGFGRHAHRFENAGQDIGRRRGLEGPGSAVAPGDPEIREGPADIRPDRKAHAVSFARSVSIARHAGLWDTIIAEAPALEGTKPKR